MLTLKVGAKKINSQPWFSFTLISALLWAEPIIENIAKINQLAEDGWYITYWTARGSVSKKDYYEFTVDQLKSWGCIFHDLIVGYRDGNLCHSTKPHFDMVIDDKAKRIEEIWKF